MGYVEKIKSKYTQIDILSRYLNISEFDIQTCIKTGALVRNPTRIDEVGSLGFLMTPGGKIHVRDFGKPEFKGDFFEIVGLLIGKDCNNTDDFADICRHILKHMGKGKNIPIIRLDESSTKNAPSKIPKTLIQIYPRAVSSEDFSYWKPLGVNPKTLHEDYVYPITYALTLKKGVTTITYKYNQYDRCYAYFFGNMDGIPQYQLYFPDRKKGERFRTNSKVIIQAPFELSKGNILIMTKSRKDVIVLKRIISRLSRQYKWKKVVHVNSFSSEGVIVTPHLYEVLSNRYNDIIFFLDNDWTGKRALIRNSTSFPIIPMLIPKNYGVKDLSEYVLKYGVKDTEIKVINIYNKFR